MCCPYIWSITTQVLGSQGPWGVDLGVWDLGGYRMEWIVSGIIMNRI